MKKDIENKTDIELLVNTFYSKVRQDDKIGPIFNEIIGSHWEHHLPKMYDFWNMVLFSAPGYAGNPTKKHLELSTKIPLYKEHFDRWLELWEETVNNLYEGEQANEAKKRAALMATLINIKVDLQREGKLIQ